MFKSITKNFGGKDESSKQHQVNEKYPHSFEEKRYRTPSRPTNEIDRKMPIQLPRSIKTFFNIPPKIYMK
jgi:hypothetical protein